MGSYGHFVFLPGSSAHINSNSGTQYYNLDIEDGMPELRAPRDSAGSSFVSPLLSVQARLSKASHDLGLWQSSTKLPAAACLVIALLFIALALCLPRFLPVAADSASNWW